MSKWDKITEERLTDWRKTLAMHNATPIVLIAIGHGERSGEVHVIRPEGDTPSDEDIAAFVRAASTFLDDDLKERGII